MRTREAPSVRTGWRIAAWLLRGFAFSLVALLGAAVFYAPALREALGPASWAASLLPTSPAGLVVWLGTATLNAGAAFLLAEHLES